MTVTYPGVTGILIRICLTVLVLLPYLPLGKYIGCFFFKTWVCTGFRRDVLGVLNLSSNISEVHRVLDPRSKTLRLTEVHQL